MIGGMMLLCAVGAMVLIAWWSLQRDDLADEEAMTGFFSLRSWSGRTVARRHGGAVPKRGSRRRDPGSGRSRRPVDDEEGASDVPSTPRHRRRR